MDKNVCDNTLVFGSCYARSCIEVPSLKAGKAKWKVFYDKFPWLKGQPYYLGQYASIISTIVDIEQLGEKDKEGQYASIISTIVDNNPKLHQDYGLVCFKNFYYCR